MASRRIPVGYYVRRPLTLWGKQREVGEYIPHSEVASLARVEAMVRSGRFNPVYEIGDNLVERNRTNARTVDSKPVVEEFKPKKAPAKKAAEKKVEQ